MKSHFMLRYRYRLAARTIWLLSLSLLLPALCAAQATFDQPLSVGSRGDEVSALQQYLKAEGYFTYPQITGYFGSYTWKAVATFQWSNGLESVGYVGPRTRALLNAALATSTSPNAGASSSLPASGPTMTASATTSPADPPAPASALPTVCLVAWCPGNGYTPGFGGGGPETVPPTISISAPVNGTKVFGTSVVLSADATDNTRVAGVQFRVDGSNVGTQVSTPPYAVNWNSTAVSDGSHTVGATAYDEAGNQAASSVAVTVDNVTPPIISAIGSSTVTATSATISWSTDEAADSQIEYGTTSSYGATTTRDATLNTTHSVPLVGLSASAIYHFRIRTADVRGNLATSSDQTLMTPPALASLPVANGVRVSAIGDSITGYNNYAGLPPSSDLGAYSYAYGAIEQALAAGPRFNFDSWYDAGDVWGRNLSGADNGVFGDHLVGSGSGTTPGILNRLPAVLAHNPDIVIFEGGTNTINSGDTGTTNPPSAAYVESEIDAAMVAIREAGKWAILSTILPRGDWPPGDPRYQVVSDVNTWIRAQSGRDGLLGVWDSWDELAPGGVQDPSLFQPGLVHPDSKGAYLMATQGSAPLLPILQSSIAAGSSFNQDPTVSNLFGSSVGNMTGTTGSKVGGAGGGATTGQVATGFSLRMTRGASNQVASKETVSGSLTRQVLTISPVSDGLSTGLHWDDTTLTSPQITTSLPTAGQWIQAYIYVEVGSTTSLGYSRLLLQVRNSTTVVAQQYGMTVFSSDFLQPTAPNRSYWIVTKPMQIPAAAFTNIMWTLETGFSNMATDTPVIKYSRPIVRVVGDPRTAWGF